MKIPKRNDQIAEWNQFIKDGDLNALSQIYFHYYDFLYTYGLKHTSEKQVVEDVIQDVFIKLIGHRNDIGEVINLSGYLLVTFRHELFLRLSKQKKIILTDKVPEETFDYFKSPEQNISEKETMVFTQRVIKKCIGNLTPKQQEIIYLRFESEIEYEEIAEILNISVDSCYKSVYRSIKILRSEVEKILGKDIKIILWCWIKSLKEHLLQKI
uniref:RNA polymerase sigma factor n=1 Tax=uncultured Draconibacterium sp. TaxID=1573823 RepID=UPI00321678D8